MIGINACSAPLVSAKTGVGIEDLLDMLVTEIPSPDGSSSEPLQALIVDSWFDSYLGVVSLIRIKNGSIKTGQKFKIHSTGQSHNVDELEYFHLKKLKKIFLSAGEVGYLVAGIKNIKRRSCWRYNSRGVMETTQALPGSKSLILKFLHQCLLSILMITKGLGMLFLSSY